MFRPEVSIFTLLMGIRKEAWWPCAASISKTSTGVTRGERFQLILLLSPFLSWKMFSFLWLLLSVCVCVFVCICVCCGDVDFDQCGGWEHPSRKWARHPQSGWLLMCSCVTQYTIPPPPCYHHYYNTHSLSQAYLPHYTCNHTRAANTGSANDFVNTKD